MAFFNFSLEENVSYVNGPPAVGPLESLYLNPYKANLLTYPRDLGSNWKNHKVSFYFYEQVSQNVDINMGDGGLIDTAKGAYDAATEMAGKTFDAAATNVQSAMNGGTTGITLSPPVNYDSFKGAVTLYMPETLEFNYDPDYSNLSLLEVAQSKLSGRVGDAITSVVDDAATKIALNQAGYIFNPQQQLLFNGIDFRTYSMSFTFTPHSQAEATTIKEIIQTFKKYAAPEVVTGAAGFFFKPPGIVYIAFNSGGKENEYIQKVKKSVVESVTVNYAPNGWASVGDDGAPVQTTMTVQFKEMELVDRKDIGMGY